MEVRQMYNKQEFKTPMPHQEPDIRNKNFSEVSLGYTIEYAVNEANRCLNCKTKPCMNGCPVNVDIPYFISFIKEGNIESAYRKIKEKNFQYIFEFYIFHHNFYAFCTKIYTYIY